MFAVPSAKYGAFLDCLVFFKYFDDKRQKLSITLIFSLTFLRLFVLLDVSFFGLCYI